MNIIEGIKSAFQNLSSSKMRTFLTMLGMIIGIGAVIMILSVGAGVQDSLTGLFDKFGKGTIQLSAYNVSQDDYFTEEDFEVIESLPGVRLISPAVSLSAQMKMKKADEIRYADVQGVSENFKKIIPVKMLNGRYITQTDEKIKANVAVIEEALAIKQFGTINAIGKKVELRYNGRIHTFEVVGVKDNTYDVAGMPQEHMPLMMYVPYTTVVNDMLDNSNGKISSAFLGTEEDVNVNEISQQIKKLLEKRHNLKNMYTVEPMAKQMGEINQQLGIMMTFISIVASISLVVGGVGIMNIMLVTVKERTKEIGIRKALGAKNKEVLTQFLIEALILTLLGGIIGMGIGYLGGMILGKLVQVTPRLTMGMLAFSVGTSSLIGLVFGVYPASQAAKLNPIEALRYE